MLLRIMFENKQINGSKNFIPTNPKKKQKKQQARIHSQSNPCIDGR